MYLFENFVLLFITLICTSLLINLKFLFLKSVPFKRPVSVRIWNPLQIPKIKQPEFADLMTSSIIKDLGEHPEDKKPVRIMKGQYGPYIKYKSLNATIPEEKDPTEITMEEALILIEKRREYDKNNKQKKRKAKWKKYSS